MIDENLNKYSFLTSKGGFLMSTQNFPNGNMGRTTFEYLLLTEDSINLRDQIDYKLGAVALIDPITGLYSRYVDKLENTSVDDYLALGTDKDNAKAILYRVRKNWGFANVELKKTFASFIYRFQGLWSHLRISAGEEMGLWGQLIWAIAIISAADEPFSYQDSWCLSHMMILTKQNRKYSTGLTNLAEKYWYYKKGDKTTSNIIADYLGPNCQDHPLIKAWEPYK